MFDRSELEKVIDLQQRSYRLLMWINRAFIHGRLSLARLHGPMSERDAAAQWLGAVYCTLPVDARPPDRGDLPRFASLFVAYLQTSFQPAAAPPRLAESPCSCTLCSYLTAPTRLVPRHLTAKANAVADRLKVLALRGLCDDRGLPLFESELAALAKGPGFPGADLVWLAYGTELLRRSEFASQGEGVFALWRQLVHHERRAGRSTVRLTPDRFLEAEASIADHLRAHVAAA